jgi:hypothetical protein
MLNEQGSHHIMLMHVESMIGGKVLVSVRDYTRHLQERHKCMPPVFYSDNGQRRTVFQVLGLD